MKLSDNDIQDLEPSGPSGDDLSLCHLFRSPLTYMANEKDVRHEKRVFTRFFVALMLKNFLYKTEDDIRLFRV